jgi:hypothetical protein
VKTIQSDGVWREGDVVVLACFRDFDKLLNVSDGHGESLPASPALSATQRPPFTRAREIGAGDAYR